MFRSSLPRRAAIVAACVGATAAVGAAPALATVPSENIFGSGSSLQNIAQGVWTSAWNSTPADRSTLSGSPIAAYTSTGSGPGLAEFGNTTGALDLTQDPTANNASTNGFGVPVLDGYVGTDDPPTGPVTTAGTNLANASLAATGSASSKIFEVTTPVALAPVAVLASLPRGITLGAGTNLHLRNITLQQIWNAAIPKSTDYAAKTWGALLELSGVHKVASSPGAGQFTDAGGSTGGAQGITLQVRTNGSGTSYTFKGFLHLSGDAKYPSSFVVDDPTWPVTTNPAGTTNAAVIATTTAAPGSITYANLADTAAAGYAKTPSTTSTGGTHQFMYATIQSNLGGTPVKYANPEGAAAGTTNVYTGNNININGTNPSGVGFWTIPLSGSTLDPTGTWGGTQASDPDVYDHDITNGVKQVKYPIVAVTYDLAWTHYKTAGSNLVNKYGGTTAQANAAANTVRSFVHYMIRSGLGQADLVNSGSFYSRLPTTIDSFALQAANAINP